MMTLDAIYLKGKKMNEYLHIMGWKKDGMWDREEVAVDVAVLSTITLLATWSVIIVSFWMS